MSPMAALPAPTSLGPQQQQQQQQQQQRPRPPPSRRRDKPQLSCNLCRRRKLKCDRQQPCSTCSGRGLSLSCTYVSNHTSPGTCAATAHSPRVGVRTQAPTSAASGSAASIQDRLGQLESLLVKLMQQRQVEETASSGTNQGLDDHSSASLSSRPSFSHPIQDRPVYTLSAADIPPRKPEEVASKGVPRRSNDVTPEYVPLKSHPVCSDSLSTEAGPPALSQTGSMHIAPSGTVYVAGEHWTAILDGIAELKSHFEERDREQQGGVAPELPQVATGLRHRQPRQATLPDRGPTLLFGCPKLETKEEILAAIPEREVADRLVFQYLNLADLVSMFLHTGQFLRQYERFWQQPSAAPILWVGLLFAIMCLGIRFQTVTAYSDTGTSAVDKGGDILHQQASLYHAKVVQCLLLDKYPRGEPGVVEVLLHYWAIEHFLRPDPEFGTWLLLGVILRLAFRMGYHRDPSHFPALTPFQGQLRRMVWMSLYDADVVISLQMGMPRMIKDSQWDTRIPVNVTHADYDEGVTEMPPGRPESEDCGTVSYTILKHRLGLVLGPIADVSTAARQCPYSEVMRLDAKLDATFAAFPDIFKFNSLVQCLADKPWHLVRRLYLTLMYHKAKLLLHRRYVDHPVPGPDCAGSSEGGGGNGVDSEDVDIRYSRTTCIRSAIKALEYQHLIDTEIQPGGRLHSVRWNISTTVSMNFLSATMVLCAHLYKRTRESSGGGDSGRSGNGSRKGGDDLEDEGRGTEDDEECGDLEAIRALLKRSHEIWLRSGARSREGRKAAEALELLFLKLDGNRRMSFSRQHISSTAATTRLTATTPPENGAAEVYRGAAAAGSDDGIKGGGTGGMFDEVQTPMWLNGQFDDAQMFDLYLGDTGGVEADMDMLYDEQSGEGVCGEGQQATDYARGVFQGQQWLL